MTCGIGNRRKLSVLIKLFPFDCVLYVSHTGHSGQPPGTRCQQVLPMPQGFAGASDSPELCLLAAIYLSKVRNDGSIEQKLDKVQKGKYFCHLRIRC